MKHTHSVTSPKQRQAEKTRDWYPYYAGFTERFADGVLSTHLPRSRRVLDPWSGSGTTTAVCVRRRIKSVGIDINPALTVIAKARLTPSATRDSLAPLGRQLVETAEDLNPTPYVDDLLSVWMRPVAVSRVRALQGAINTALISGPPGDPRDLSAAASGMPVLAAFFYSALFAAVRDLLGRFRGTNPTWIMEPSTARHKIAPSRRTLTQAFRSRIEFLRDRLAVEAPGVNGRLQAFRTGSATRLPFREDFFDGALTSPPYATRIDYVRGVLPELAVLGANWERIEELRRVSTGSPVVRGAVEGSGPLSSAYATEVLDQIRNHPTKGSRAYYWPWMSNYLGTLQGGLLETNRVVSSGSPICVVVQDSHYKELHVDLQRIVVETLAPVGRELLIRRDFEAKNLRSRMNPRARKHLARRQNSESLLVFN